VIHTFETALYAEMKENVLSSEKEYASKPIRDYLKGMNEIDLT
jgi:hypothetical protein